MKTLAPQYSDRLVAHAQNWAQKAGRSYEYGTGQFRDSGGSSRFTIPFGRNSLHSGMLLFKKLLRILRRSSGKSI
jgi:hypothetical protein